MSTLCRRQLAAVLLLVLAAVLQQPHPAAGGTLDEGTIMRRLRQRANEAGLVGRQGGKWTGWGLDDPAHHCSWHHVACDPSKHITQIVWKSEGAVHFEAHSRNTALLPELAQLQYLARLELEIEAPAARLPPECLSILLQALTAADPLPPVQPGALPQLTNFTMMLIKQARPIPLPASWGRPDVLLSLRELYVTATVALPLPANWARGFPALQTLLLQSNSGPSSSQAAARVNRTGTDSLTSCSSCEPHGHRQPDGASHPLPAEWARGFPNLQSLSLVNFGLSGTFPAAWQARGSFPELRDLELGSNRLSGLLPADVVCNLPHLQYLSLGGNRFTGGLPAEWAACGASLTDIDLQHNQLTGPAFPPAWLAPNSTLNLLRLQLNDNPGLEGTLPASLSWSRLENLYLHGTGVDGRIHEQWCRAPFAHTIRQIDTDAIKEPKFFKRLPACVERDMPNFVTWAKEIRQQAASISGGAAGTAWFGIDGPGKMLLLLVVVALLAIGAATAVIRSRGQLATAAWLPTWLRQRQHSSSPATEEEGIELLWRELAEHSSRVQRRRAARHCELAPGRARLKALAQRQLGGTALLSGRSEAELLSVLRGAPAHSMAAPVDGRTPGGFGYLSQAGPRGVALQLVRRWGLPTESLRIAAADVQFIAEPNGSLVQLGEGAHGVVYLAKLSDMYVAVKVFAVQPGMDSQGFWREISLLARCEHPRIVPVYGVAVHGELVMVAMQLMLGGSLRVALADPKLQAQLRWNNCGRRLALDVAEAVAYLHGEMRILHSDIKSANVLLDQDWRASLTDLGVAQVVDNTARTAAGGSRMYAAPEQLLGQRCTLAADIYSLGLLLTELTTRKAIVKRGHWELPRVPGDCPQDVADLIDQCLLSDPSQRPTAAEVLRRLRASGGGGGGSDGSG